MRQFILLNRPEEIARLQDQLERIAREQGIDRKDLSSVQLAIEELLTNVINHAFADQGQHEIKVRLRADKSEWCIEVEDDGRAFNLLEQPAPDLSLPLDQRPIGGLGIHMIRKSMDRIEYRRVDDRNIVAMTKQIKAPAP